MKSSWKKVCLGDIISIKHGWAFPGIGITSQKSKNVLVTPGNFEIGGGFKYSDKKFFNKDYPEDYLLSPGDLIVTMTDLSKETDTLGYSALVPNDGRNYLHNQRIGLVQLKNCEVDKLFIYWLMRTKLYQRFVANYAHGTSVKHTSPSLIGKFCFMLPDIAEQKKISSILSALDKKIAINKAINKNLEETAQAIFKSWFVGFEPFGGVMPADWRIGTFSDIVKTTFGGDWGKEIPEGNHTKQVFCIRGADIPEVKLGNKGKMPIRYILSQNYALKQLTVGDIVIEISGGSPTQSTGRVCYISQALLDRYDRGIVCTNFCRAIKTKEHFSQFVYYYLQYLYTGDVFFSYENGTTGIKNFDLSGFLKTKEIVIPSSNYLYKFNELCLSVFAKTFSIGLQIQRLAEIRDALLPKLMSGEIDVSQVKI